MIPDLPSGWTSWSPTAQAELLAMHQQRIQDEERLTWLRCDRACDGQPHPDVPYRHARPGQRPPPGRDWALWLLLAGRGYGKTRTGAEWAWRKARDGQERGALVAPTAGDARDVMVEGESGIMACVPNVFRPKYEPSKRRLTYPNGAQQAVYSADEPDRLRGPQHNYAWCLSPGTLIATATGPVPIEQVQDGDMVWTRSGLRPVVGTGSRWAGLSAITLSDGRELVGSGDHPIMTSAGWVALANLRPGDLVATTADPVAVRDASTSGLGGQVYSLQVADTPEFFANGILTHNCDELAAWKLLSEAWSNLELGMRLGEHPEVLATTTPRPKKLIIELAQAATTHITRGSTYENLPNLAESFRRNVLARYEGTRLGRQELMAELLTDIEGALWTSEGIERDRIKVDELPLLTRVVVAIDPAVTSGDDADDTGIVVAGIDHRGHAFVLDDLTMHDTPQEWAKVALQAYTDFDADRIIAETNNGGDMVAAVLRAQPGGSAASFKRVTASRGKRVRAEPIAALYEQHRVHHVGIFPELEDQMTTWTPDVNEGSPDRMDALVWAVTELLVEPQRKKGGWSF